MPPRKQKPERTEKPVPPASQPPHEVPIHQVICGQVQKTELKAVPIKDLIPYPKNPRKNDNAVAALATSLKEYGYVKNSILVDENMELLAGHTTLKAMVSLGWDKVPEVTQVSGLTAAQKKGYRIADNKLGELAEWDPALLIAELDALKIEGFDIALTGFDPKEIAGLELELHKDDVPQDAEPQISRAEELRKEWGTELGQMWQCGIHRVICGDCTDPAVVARVMQGEKAQTVFTSPPYAVGVDYASYSDTIENLREMLPKLAEQWYNMVVPGGFAVVNFGDIVSAQNILKTDEPCEYPMALEYWPVFRAAGWVLWSRRIWCKPGAGTGSMQCISSNRAATNWEHVWTWKAPGPAMFPKQTTGEYPSQNGWFDSSHSTGLDVKLKVHGAGMPLLPAMFSISNHSTPAGIVFEPFSGTGTTMIACENLGRTCRGVEIDPGYTAVCLQRYKDVTGNDPVLVDE